MLICSPARLVPIYGFGLGFIFLLAFRNLARLIRTELFTFDIGLNRVLIIGSTSMSHELLESLLDSRQSGYKVVAVVGDKSLHAPKGIRHFLNFVDAIEYIREPMHTIIQTELYADEAHNREILEYAQARRQTIVTADSCSAGVLGLAFARGEGASETF